MIMEMDFNDFSEALADALDAIDDTHVINW